MNLVVIANSCHHHSSSSSRRRRRRRRSSRGGGVGGKLWDYGDLGGILLNDAEDHRDVLSSGFCSPKQSR